MFEWLYFVGIYLCGLCTGAGAAVFWLKPQIPSYPQTDRPIHRPPIPPLPRTKRKSPIAQSDEKAFELEAKRTQEKGWDAAADV